MGRSFRERDVTLQNRISSFCISVVTSLKLYAYCSTVYLYLRAEICANAMSTLCQCPESPREGRQLSYDHFLCLASNETTPIWNPSYRCPAS